MLQTLLSSQHSNHDDEALAVRGPFRFWRKNNRMFYVDSRLYRLICFTILI